MLLKELYILILLIQLQHSGFFISLFCFNMVSDYAKQWKMQSLRKLYRSPHADIHTEVISDSKKLGVGKTQSGLGAGSSSAVSQHIKNKTKKNPSNNTTSPTTTHTQKNPTKQLICS